MSLVLYENIRECLTLAGAAKEKGRHPKEASLGIIQNAAIVVDDTNNVIQWVGETKALPGNFQTIVNRYSCADEIWFPEFVECHTHLVFGGWRYADFDKRCQGKSYQDIAQEGGGILTTINATREASLESLYEGAILELERFQKYGVGTIEIKSGYGLTLENELKLLNCIKRIQDTSSLFIVATFMPAHAIPPEFKGRSDDFVKVICEEWIPEVAKQKLADFFDVFIEENYFSVSQARKMVESARNVGFKIKLHSDQFTSMGGVELGVEVGATSIDHLEQISQNGISALSQSDTVAVLAPGASLFTKTAFAPARKLIDAGARVALTTDFNPGTCTSRNLPLMTTLGACQMQMTIPETIVAITLNAAAALGLEKTLGSLESGKIFRVSHLNAESYQQLPYLFGEL